MREDTSFQQFKDISAIPEHETFSYKETGFSFAFGFHPNKINKSIPDDIEKYMTAKALLGTAVLLDSDGNIKFE